VADENVSENDETQTETEAQPEVVEEPAAEAQAADADAEAPAEEPVAEAAAEEAPTEDAPADEPESETEAPAAEAADEAPADAPDVDGAEETTPAEPTGKQKKKRLPRSLRPAKTRRRRIPSTERKAITRVPKPEYERGRRQERQGKVVSAGADKTIVVRVEVAKAHPVYKKVIRRSTKLHAHDEQNQAKVGDIVRIVETRPLSKLKRWRLREIVEVAK
jgi:small subunit ribosomal protein S17